MVFSEMEKALKLLNEISLSVQEQHLNAEQINGAIHQLSQVTQLNAASSEELAANSEELTNQAEQLRDAVSFFKY